MRANVCGGDYTFPNQYPGYIHAINIQMYISNFIHYHNSIAARVDIDTKILHNRIGFRTCKNMQ